MCISQSQLTLFNFLQNLLLENGCIFFLSPVTKTNASFKRCQIIPLFSPQLDVYFKETVGFMFK